MTVNSTTAPAASGTPTASSVSGRVIALAHYAARAALETVLARYDLTFQQSVVLRVVAVADGPVAREAVVDQVVDSLKIGAAEVRGVLAELAAAELVADAGDGEPGLVAVTDAGREVHARTTAETGVVSARIYAGIPAEDLAVAGRVLGLVTDRANAELAAAR
ncbi:MarR family transcriptional regulator [Streptomyces heilongjiangensis]|uniref:MarR family transcriptional regulator n=1 Tax=Streptomyces heilongjiangensis TaxID=945052 RepID=A0ABW1BDT3_9ACTN|nr:MarR family transcriptional regulator [Streptomyces heilongjiangensis]MDC2948923.1 MarR family transcriptional regulator [Streptomyces heilongjiangensis]